MDSGGKGNSKVPAYLLAWFMYSAVIYLLFMTCDFFPLIVHLYLFLGIKDVERERVYLCVMHATM